ncbi:MAG: MmcQ/YjbR family DNA-binding protein [Planctomycetota bacterium]|nr:MAG: MmcQ/YjbR family DNA-binding protein [Planctomycetota bacterium]
MLTGSQFRRMALALPEAQESAHMGHPDFRVHRRIFATLSGEGESRGMLKLTPEQQRQWMQAEPEVFVPAAGAWGLRGATMVELAAAQPDSVRVALEAAWRNVAPKRLL